MELLSGVIASLDELSAGAVSLEVGVTLLPGISELSGGMVTSGAELESLSQAAQKRAAMHRAILR